MTRREGRTTARNSIRTAVSTLTGTALLATALIAGTTTGAAGAPTSPGNRDQVSFEPGRYIVTLADSAVATYDGGIDGYSATQPPEGSQLNFRRAPVQKYSNYLADKQRDVAESVNADIDYSLTVAINAFTADLTAKQAAELLSSKEVISLTPDELHQVDATPSTEFLGLEGPDGVWEQVGGVDVAGAGVVVGVLDTGIAPENPSFAGDELGTDPGDEPYLSGDNVISFKKADGGTFTGTCEVGEQFTEDDCNTKLIGARYYVDGFGVDDLGDETTGPGEFVSPRDGDGHGSHTASTAAGNADVAASVAGIDFGTISGVAPAAKIAAYKVCWSGPDPTVTTDDGCATSDMLAGIDQAVQDGVDVINMSIGGGAASTTYSALDDAFLGAAAAGIFVAVSAGNTGPGASTLDHGSPWYTTVAASTIPSYEATVTLGNGEDYAGASITVTEEVSGALVHASELAVEGEAGAQANLCAPNSLDAALITEPTIVVCERGVFDRVAKSAEVDRIGGIGMVHVNVDPGSIDIDEHSVPTVHLDAMYYEPVVTYAATEGATATLTPENTTGVTPPTPQVAGFSSRGPVLADGSDIIKPDISAPGVSILAAGPNQEDEAGTQQFLSGTSMAAPHIAGLAALYFGERPNVSPAEIKSAMMTTAYNTVDAAGDAVTNPFVQGAGHVNPPDFFDPGLLYLNGLFEWLGYLEGIGYQYGFPAIDPSDLNLASIGVGTLTAPETITRTVTATAAGEYTASIEGMEGVDVTVEPSSFTVDEGQSVQFTVTFARTDAPLDEYATGALVWESDTHTVRSPIAVQPVTIVAPDDVEGTGVAGSVDVAVTPGGTGDIVLGSTGLSLGEDFTGSGAPGDFEEYVITVPENTEFARFDVDAVDDTADLDLTVFQLNAQGTPIAGWQSATGSADERVDLVSPDAADYLVYVDVFSGDGEPAWLFSATSIVPGGAPVTFTPPVIDGVQGEPTEYNASWSGLAAQSVYLGLIEYGDTGMFTVLQVTTGEAPDVEVDRLTGSDRYAVGVSVSQALFPEPGDGVPVVYVANGANFPDALSAAPAAVKQGGPLLLTPSGTLPTDVREEIVRLNPDQVVIAGGPASVSPAIMADLVSIAGAGNVTRLDGPDRYAVSRAVVEHAWDIGNEAMPVIYVTTGVTFADALSASAASGSIDAPVLLVPGTASGLDSSTEALIEAMEPTTIKIAGGSVSAGIAQDLEEFGTVLRLGGADRFIASQTINRDAFDSSAHVYLTTGFNFPDGLVGAALAGAQGAPLYTVPTNCVPPAVLEDIEDLGATHVHLLGGPATLTADVLGLKPCG